MSNGNTKEVDFEHIDTESLPPRTWGPPFRKAPDGWVEVDWTQPLLAAGPLAMPPQGGKDKEK
jgi:hypothetical protein